MTANDFRDKFNDFNKKNKQEHDKLLDSFSKLSGKADNTTRYQQSNELWKQATTAQIEELKKQNVQVSTDVKK